MGQLLSQPVIEKTSEEGKDERLTYGLSSMQGWRITMEDSHATVLDLKSRLDTDKKVDESFPKVSFFGVYDGHGGEKTAQFVGENLHNIVARQSHFAKQDFGQALKDGFLAADRAILQDAQFKLDQSGCTATTAIFADGKVYVANAGDSRTILGSRGYAKPLSFDHKPHNEGERARIVAAGGFVESQRVNGNLALSRAIGDFDFKKTSTLPPEEQIVTAFPDVMEHQVNPDDEFLVLACDGIWDCLQSQQVVEFVRRGIKARQSLKTICENMMNHCLAPKSDMTGVGCDNMTVMVVGLLQQGQSEEEWYDMISDRIDKKDGPVADESAATIKDCNFDEADGDHPMQEPSGPSGGGIFSLEQLLGHTQSILKNRNGQYYLEPEDAAKLLNEVGLTTEGHMGELGDVEDEEHESDEDKPRIIEEHDENIDEEPESSDHVKSPVPTDESTSNNNNNNDKS